MARPEPGRPIGSTKRIRTVGAIAVGKSRLLSNCLRSCIILVLVGHVGRLWLTTPIHREYPGDFANIWAGAVAVAEGLNPYDPAVHLEIAHSRGAATVHGRFIYPPLVPLMFRPFTLLSWPAAVQAMLLLSLIAIAMSAVILIHATPWRRDHAFAELLIALQILAYHPVQWNLVLGNLNPLILLLVVVGFWQVYDRPFLAAILFGLAAAMKITPVAMLIAFWIWYGRRKLALCSIVTAIVATAIAAVLTGFRSSIDYFTILVPQFIAGNVGEPLAFPDNQAIGGLFGRLLTDGGVTTPWGHCPLIARVCAFAVGLFFVFITGRQFVPSRTRNGERQLIAVVLTLSVIVPMYTHAIYSVWLLPAFALATVFALNTPRQRQAAWVINGLCFSYATIGIIFPLRNSFTSSGPLLPLTSLPLVGAVILWRILLRTADQCPASSSPCVAVKAGCASRRIGHDEDCAAAADLPSTDEARRR